MGMEGISRIVGLSGYILEIRISLSPGQMANSVNRWRPSRASYSSRNTSLPGEC